jgi:DNA (cytosine-5)-methyltransferase 1
VKYPKLGTIASGKLLIPQVTFPKAESECTLSDILEEEVPDKYFLSEEQTQKILFKSQVAGRAKGCTAQTV